MKPISIQIYLVQIFLIVLATSFAFLSIGVMDYDIVFWNAIWGYISHGEAKLPIILGIIPFSHLSIFLSFLFCYLIFEFYGLKTALYTCLAISAVLLIQFYTFFGLQTLKPQGLDHQILLSSVPFSYLNTKSVQSLSGAISTGFSAIFILSWIFKKLTKNYFMFFRFTLASWIGFSVFAFVRIWILKMSELGQMSIIMESVTPALQFVILTALSIVPLYLLRLILGVFRGKTFTTDDKWNNSTTSIFKAPSKEVVTLPSATTGKVNLEIEDEVTNDKN